MGAKDGTVEPVAGAYVLRFERWFPHPLEWVWSALTDAGELSGWLAAARLDLSVGGEVMLHWLNTDGAGEGNTEGNESLLHGAITALVPPMPDVPPETALIEYDTDLHGLMRWELRAEADGCALAFTNTSPAPPDHLLRVVAGWHIHLDHLEDALDGSPVDWASWTPTTRATASGLSWSDHCTRYSARLAR